MTRDFYRADALTLAERLIGKTLVNVVNGEEIAAVISETEAYMGIADPACHSFGNRRTKRTETMYLDGGHAYVYLIYGMYSCMNVTASEVDDPQAVLIRAAYIVNGAGAALSNVKRTSKRKSLPEFATSMTGKELYSLSNGPGKLCNAMQITRELDGIDIMSGELYIRDDGFVAEEILRAPRIGIDYAGEAASYPWRFTAAEENGIPKFKVLK